jgi:hypothetical protein
MSVESMANPVSRSYVIWMQVFISFIEKYGIVSEDM